MTLIDSVRNSSMQDVMWLIQDMTYFLSPGTEVCKIGHGGSFHCCRGRLRWRPWVCRQPHGADPQTSAELCWTKWVSLRTIISGTSGPELLNYYVSLIKLTIFFRDKTFNSVKFYWNTIQQLTEEVLYKVSFYSIQSSLSAYYFFFSQGCTYFNGYFS